MFRVIRQAFQSFLGGNDGLDVSGKMFEWNQQGWTLKHCLLVFILGDISSSLLQAVLPVIHVPGLSFLFFIWWFHPDRDSGIHHCFQIPDREEVPQILSLAVKWAVAIFIIRTSIVYLQIHFFQASFPVLNPLHDSKLPFWEVIVFAVSAVVVGPIWEEFLFRQILYQSLGAHYMVSAMVSSALWAGMHFSLEWFPYLMISGLIYIYLYESSKNIWYPIAVHALINALSVAVSLTSLI